MRSAERVPYRWDTWQPWFAWRPVIVHAGDSRMWAWVWWEWIERKYVPSYDSMSVSYRLRTQT